MASRSTDDIKVEVKKSQKTLGEKAKKKNWYTSYLGIPSYKSRTEDFKKLFNIPEDERLLVGK